MKLNAPDLKCDFCKGTGLRLRELRLVVKDRVMNTPARAALHCSCLSPELKALHEGLDKESVLRDWPWDELKDLKTPKAEGGPEPVLLGCPFPLDFIPPKRKEMPASPEPAPQKKEEPAPEKPKKRGRAKIKK